MRELVADLNRAETLFYQYQIDGDSGFANQYQTQTTNASARLAEGNAQGAIEPLQSWLGEISLAHDTASNVGEELLLLQQQREADIQHLHRLTNQLSQRLLAYAPADAQPEQYRQIASMVGDVHRLEVAVVSHIAIPQSTTRTDFTNAAIAWNANANALLSRDASEDLREIVEQFDQIEATGTKIINDRDRQNLHFATFASNQFFINEQMISNRILPHLSRVYLDTQESMGSRITVQTIGSISVAFVGAIASLSIAIPMLRTLNRSINSLLVGAGRIRLGDYSTEVMVDTSDEMSNLAAMFNTMMEELQNRELRLQRRIQELEALRQKLTLVQEEERRLVGLDLHDGLTQMLLSANMHINTLAALLDASITPQAQTELELVQQRLQESIDEVRWVIAELRPTELEDYGLVDGMRHYVNKMAQGHPWKVSFLADIPDVVTDTIDRSVETALFRIFQEALSNAKKHAKADAIQVVLTSRDRLINVQVSDNGVGFDPTAQGDDAINHLGLLGMQERATALGGTVEIDSGPMRGTTIGINVPLPRGDHAHG